MALLAIGAEALGRLQSATRQTAVLSRVICRTVTVLTTITATSALEIGFRPGSDLSLHATATGKVGTAYSHRGILTARSRAKLGTMSARTGAHKPELPRP